MAFAQFVQISAEQAGFLKILKKTVDAFGWYEHNAPRSRDRQPLQANGLENETRLAT